MRRLLTIMLMAAAMVSVSLGFAAVPASADVDDFEVESFDVLYQLDRDDVGRSTLLTTETITIIFPDYDQNRGFIRDIPLKYNGQHTMPTVISVTDENGAPRPYQAGTYEEYRSVTMAVPEGSFVHGRQTYVLTYEQKDVIKYFADTGVEEFYWDTNGTGWAQPFGSIEATLVLSDEIASEFTSDAFCYRGTYGSTDTCGIDIDGNRITASGTDFAPYENLTVAVAFKQGTFWSPPVPFFERVPLLLIAGVLSLLASLTLTIIGTVKNFRGKKTGKPIIARYTPPKNTSAALSANIVDAKNKSTTATLLDLAVRGKIRLVYDEVSKFYGIQKKEYSDLLPEEKTFLDSVFKRLKTEDTYWIDGKDTKLGDAAQVLIKDANKLAVSSGLRRKGSTGLGVLACILLLLSVLITAIHFFITGDDALFAVTMAVGINVAIWSSFLIIFLTVIRKPRTEAGALMHDHLEGLRDYIRLAEADRLRMLQSESGAEVGPDRNGSDSTEPNSTESDSTESGSAGSNNVVHIYELLLPYAVIFSLEKEWQAELSRLYVTSEPTWVTSTDSSTASGRNMQSLLAGGIIFSNLDSAVKKSPITRASSGSGSSFSSMGGSSGGGFSGGGGGGGGGRGI